MNQLDDFEKYLRDQLKGHAEPDPLMWKRLTDTLERVQPWYARSVFKYALTAFGAMVFGAISSYLYFDQQHTPNQSVVQTETQTAKQTKSTTQSQTQSPAKSTDEASVNVPMIGNIKDMVEDESKGMVTSHLFDSFKGLVENPIRSQVNGDKEGPVESIVKRVFENPEEGPEEGIANVTGGSEEVKLPLLSTNKINIAQQVLLNTPRKIASSGRFELSIASGQTRSNLPNFNYQLGNQGMQQGAMRQQQSPQLLAQVRIYKNWHIQAGVQYLQSELTEHFYHANVFSYDEKEHYLFPYLYGFRQISDEELHEGPWPFGPNQPGGPEISIIKADYTSIVRKQQVIVPLTLSYHRQIGAFEAQIHAGLALCFDTKTSQSLTIPGYLPTSIYLQSPNGRLQTFAQSQVRLSYRANPHLSIFMEPQLRSGLRQQNLMHSSPYRSNSKAFFAGLSWKF